MVLYLGQSSHQSSMEDCLTRSKSHREDADDSTQKFCQALCQTGIPLHQTDGPLGSLFQDKCPAARTMPSSTQMYRKYLPEVYEHDLETIKEAVKNHPISLTIDKTPELCGRPAVAVLVTFYDDEVPGCRTAQRRVYRNADTRFFKNL